MKVPVSHSIHISQPRCFLALSSHRRADFLALSSCVVAAGPAGLESNSQKLPQHFLGELSSRTSRNMPSLDPKGPECRHPLRFIYMTLVTPLPSREQWPHPLPQGRALIPRSLLPGYSGSHHRSSSCSHACSLCIHWSSFSLTDQALLPQSCYS